MGPEGDLYESLRMELRRGSLTLGVLARLMPQLQVFFLAVPINIFAGFLIMLAMLGAMMTLFLNYYTQSMGIFL